MSKKKLLSSEEDTLLAWYEETKKVSIAGEKWKKWIRSIHYNEHPEYTFGTEGKKGEKHPDHVLDLTGKILIHNIDTGRVISVFLVEKNREDYPEDYEQYGIHSDKDFTYFQWLHSFHRYDIRDGYGDPIQIAEHSVYTELHMEIMIIAEFVENLENFNIGLLRKMLGNDIVYALDEAGKL